MLIMNTLHGLVTALFIFLMAFSCHCADYKTVNILPPFPELSGSFTNRSEADGLVIPFVLKDGEGRASWDFPLRGDVLEGTTSLVIDASLSVNGFISGMTLQIRSGLTWNTARIPLPESHRGRVAVPLSRFKDEVGEACKFSHADLLRISIWCADPRATGTFLLYGLQARRDSVAIANTGDDASLARCRTLFDKAGIPYAEIDDDFTQASDFNLVVIPTTPLAFEVGALRELKRAVRTGVKLVVFYTASREISALLGISPGEWRGVPPASAWMSMIPAEKPLAGFSERIPHQTTNIIPPYERPSAITVAVWSDSVGHETKLPACVVSEKGAWFSHLPPLPTRPAAEFMRRICLRFEPRLAESFAVKALMDNAAVLDASPKAAEILVNAIKESVLTRTKIEGVPQRCSELRDFIAADLVGSVLAPTGEVHAVWDARAPYRSEATWGKLLFKLGISGINTLFAQVGNGVSSDTAFDATSGLSLQKVCEKAHESSVSVHAWLYVLSLEGTAPSDLATLTAQGSLVTSQDGSQKPWLCSVNLENRKQIIARSVTLANSGVAGIHLDYIRYPDDAGCFCASCRAAFERSRGQKVAYWPFDVTGTGVYSRAYRGFQTQSITELVASLSDAVRKSNSGVVVSAAVFPDVPSAAALCQDWPGWVGAGLVDFVCPMTYQTDSMVFASQVDRAIAACAGRADRVLPGIGTTADVAGPDAYGAAQQLLEARKRKCLGFAFFSLDDLLLNSILPFLTLSSTSQK